MLRTGPYRTTRTQSVRASGHHGPVGGKSDACGRLGCLSRGKPQRQGDVRSTSPNSGQGGLEPCPQGNPSGIEPGEASGAKPQRGGGIRFFNRRGEMPQKRDGGNVCNPWASNAWPSVSMKVTQSLSTASSQA